MTCMMRDRASQAATDALDGLHSHVAVRTGQRDPAVCRSKSGNVLKVDGLVGFVVKRYGRHDLIDTKISFLRRGMYRCDEAHLDAVDNWTPRRQR